MSAFTDFLPMVQAAVPMQINEDDLLVAICKVPSLPSDISKGGSIPDLLQRNLQPIVSIVAATASTSYLAGRVEEAGGQADEAVLQEIANMVAYVTSGYTVEKLKNYISGHPDVKAEYDKALAQGPEAVKSYLSPKVTEIAMAEFGM